MVHVMLRKFLPRQTTGFLQFSTRKFNPCNLFLFRNCSYIDQNLEPEMAGGGGTEYHDFPKEEEKILELWGKLDAFKTCLRQSKDKPRLELRTSCFLV